MSTKKHDPIMEATAERDRWQAELSQASENVTKAKADVRAAEDRYAEEATDEQWARVMAARSVLDRAEIARRGIEARLAKAAEDLTRAELAEKVERATKVTEAAAVAPFMAKLDTLARKLAAIDAEARAVIAEIEGATETQAGHVREAQRLARELGLPAPAVEAIRPEVGFTLAHYRLAEAADGRSNVARWLNYPNVKQAREDLARALLGRDAWAVNQLITLDEILEHGLAGTLRDEMRKREAADMERVEREKREREERLAAEEARRAEIGEESHRYERAERDKAAYEERRARKLAGVAN